MRKSIGVLAVLLIIGVIITLYVSRQASHSPAPKANTTATSSSNTGLIKAVHYFASAWPKTFWEDFEKSQVAEDFAQIKADGFNTIILVIPWRGFETGFETGQTKPSSLYDRLEWLLAQIEQAGLDFGLRISFPHNFDPDNGISTYQLCHDLFMDPDLRQEWLGYVTRLARRVERHRESLRFAFFSWEDFFCPYSAFSGMPIEQRLALARASGFQDWLEENHPMTLVEFLYLRSFESTRDVPLPEDGSPAKWLLYKFVDQFLINEFLLPGRQILPELAMEVRVDKDPIQIGDSIFWASHDLALSDTQLRGSYWGPSYGAQNEGESLTADQALQNFEYMLNEVTKAGENTNHIVEQFNFLDNTPAYIDRNAHISESEIPGFLQGAADLLNEKSRGYGLWAYRDYADSALYNSSFELDLRGWSNSGDLTVVTDSAGDKALHMHAGASVSQEFSPFDRFVALGHSEKITFCANFTHMGVKARVSLLLDDSEIGAMDIEQTDRHCVNFDPQLIQKPVVVFSFSTDAEIMLDDLRLFAFVQKLDVYDETGQPGRLRDVIHQLNTEWLKD